LQTQGALETLIEVFENIDTSSGVLNAPSVLKINVGDLKVKSVEQATILYYLCKKGSDDVIFSCFLLNFLV
jgi:hypothetical protein